MIHQTLPTWQVFTWKDELKNAVTDVSQLLTLLALKPGDFSDGIVVNSEFPLRVPISFIRRMEIGNPADPLLLQVLPLKTEQTTITGFTKDPLNEKQYNPAPGIIHKYSGRVLLVATPVCAINCRYCFRRHFPYTENTPGKRQWLESLGYIANDTSITEVILSGGDPLAANNQHLKWLVDEIEKIPHVARLRIHSRLPVVIPSRVDNELLSLLKDRRLLVTVVLHINHANEIDEELAGAVAHLRRINTHVLNQSVLLRGINDNLPALQTLSEKMFAIGILPYYLHALDPIEGAHHFDVPESNAQELHQAMKSRLPGYLLPRLVKDIPGEMSKVHINAQN